MDLLVNLEVAIFVDVNNLLVFFGFFFRLVHESASLDSEYVQKTLHDIAVELVRHCPCALYDYLGADRSYVFDDLKFAVLKSRETKFT